MKPDEYVRLHAEVCRRARALSEDKGHDYSGLDDTLRNLKTCEHLGLAKTEVGILIRIADKINRLSTHLTAGEAAMRVKDESILDTTVDAINYLVLMLAALHEKGIVRIDCAD